jgi:RNA-directed DNA polymerase
VGTGEALGGPGLRVREASAPITGDQREVAGGHQGVGGVVVPLDGLGQHNPAGGKDPCFIDAGVAGRDAVSARLLAGSTAKADGLDKVRALQRVLYRSAKQQPQRRFHALFDKVARGDILCRGLGRRSCQPRAPGVDGVTIADVEASGVAAFLGDLAAALRTGGYRPAPLRRVHIPSRASRAPPGRSGSQPCATGWR